MGVELKDLFIKSLTYLGKKERIFHSESELVYYVSKVIAEQNDFISDIFIEYPEYRIKKNNRSIRIDLIITIDEKKYAVEFKYIKGNYKDDIYNLTRKPADECHEIINDISRMEEIVNFSDYDGAFIIVLGNNNSYWKHPSKNTKLALSMYLVDKTIKRKGNYEYVTGSKEKKHTKQNTTLKNDYEINWQDYCKKNGEEFKYLILEIKK